MRIPKSELTPAINADIGRILGTLHIHESHVTDPERIRAKGLAGKRYFSSRIAALVGWSLYPVAIFGAMVAVKTGLHASPLWGFLATAPVAIPLYLALPSTHGYTPEELRAYLPLLSLPTAEMAYLEATIEAYSEGAAPSLREEVLPAMRRFVEESARLDRLEAQLAEGGSNTVRAEADAMRARLATIEDASAREALGSAIAIAERRLGSAISESAARERIEAHRAIIRQAALSARETVRRLRLAPESAGRAADHSGDLDLSALRASAEGAGREVAALEAAVQEMRAL